MTNPEAMQDALAGGLFDPEPSTAQKAALEKLEVTLALVEGWVDEVVSQATAERMPAAAKLQETVRRRRAAGGPAEQTFATLVGLELRPRRLRDASVLWGSLRTRQGAEARDGVWMSPRPAAHRRRPRRPAGLPRGLGDARRAVGGGVRRRPARPARRRRQRHPPGRVTLTGAGALRSARAPRDAVATLAGWVAPTPAQAALRDRYLAHLAAHPDGLAKRVPPRPPHRRRDRRLPRRRRGAPQPPPQGRRLARLRRPPRARRRARWPAAPGARPIEESGLDGPSTSTRSRCRSTSTRWSSAPTAAPSTTSTYASWPPPSPTPAHATSEESLDVRWWPVDASAGDVRRHVRPHRGRGRAARPLGPRRRLVLVDARGRLEPGGRGVALEVALRLVRAGVAVDPRPERRRVARLQQVGQLVDQHVVDDPAGHLLQPVAEPDGAVARGARAPAGCWLVTHRTDAGTARPPR